MLFEIMPPKQNQQPSLITTPVQQNQGWEFLTKYPFAKKFLSLNSPAKMHIHAHG